MAQMTQSQVDTLREHLNRSYNYFAECFTDPDFYDGNLHGDLCHFLQHTTGDKLVVLPRTFLKTTIAAALYCLWLATRNPSIRILITSNTTTNAQKTVHTIKGIVENNQLYQLLFPEVIPNFNRTRWSDSCACLQRPVDHPEGTFEAAGVGANIIRRHFNVIVEDDTVAPKKDELTGEEAMPTRDDIEKAVGFHRLTMPLLIDEADFRLVIGTRWASYDLINHIKENEPSFNIFDRKCYRDDGTPTYRRFSAQRLDKIRESMGAFMFSSLYLNTPLAKQQMAFNPDHLVYYNQSDLPTDGYTKVSVDPADPPTGDPRQDHTAIVGCRHTSSGVYVLKYIRERVSEKQMIDKTLALCDEIESHRIVIEVNRYGHLVPAFRQAMTDRGKYYSVEGVKAKGMKEERIQARLAPMFENGVLKLRRNMASLEHELFTFPYGKHDDVIDALAWQMDRVMTKKPIHEETPTTDNNQRMSFTLDDIRKGVRKNALATMPHLRRHAGLSPFERHFKN